MKLLVITALLFGTGIVAGAGQVFAPFLAQETDTFEGIWRIATLVPSLIVLVWLVREFLKHLKEEREAQRRSEEDRDDRMATRFEEMQTASNTRYEQQSAILKKCMDDNAAAAKEQADAFKAQHDSCLLMMERIKNSTGGHS